MAGGAEKNLRPERRSQFLPVGRQPEWPGRSPTAASTGHRGHAWCSLQALLAGGNGAAGGQPRRSAPYFFFWSVHYALVGSVIVTLLALLIFGYAKGRFTTARPFRSAWQTVIAGGLAATTAFVIAKLIG